MRQSVRNGRCAPSSPLRRMDSGFAAARRPGMTSALLPRRQAASPLARNGFLIDPARHSTSRAGGRRLNCVRRFRVALVVVLASLWGVPGHAEVQRSSGYALGPELCGSAPLAFPRIPVDMKKGFCAGLVAGAQDGLRFPRGIVQIPGQRQFVVADMGGWGHSDGRLLMLDPQAAPGQRLREVLTGLDYPFGLAIGPDNKLYASTAETIFRVRSAERRPEGQRRDHRPQAARSPHHAGRRHRDRGERASDEGIRLRPDRAAVRQCRRA